MRNQAKKIAVEIMAKDMGSKTMFEYIKKEYARLYADSMAFKACYKTFVELVLDYVMKEMIEI